MDIAPDTPALVRAEIDMQISTAHAYPRNVVACRDELVALVTLDLDVAESCVYSLPRDGKAVTGPSVRLAEMAITAWRNTKCAWRVTNETDSYVECEGIAHDMEKNVVFSGYARRMLLDRYGKRYSPSMVQTTTQACGAIAYRNAVFKVIPAALINPAIKAARQYILDNVGDYQQKIPDLARAMEGVGVSIPLLCRYFNLDKIDDISADQYVTTKGIYSAIVAGDTVAGDYFGTAKTAPEKKKSGVSLDNLGGGQAGGAG